MCFVLSKLIYSNLFCGYYQTIIFGYSSIVNFNLHTKRFECVVNLSESTCVEHGSKKIKMRVSEEWATQMPSNSTNVIGSVQSQAHHPLVILLFV